MIERITRHRHDGTKWAEEAEDPMPSTLLYMKEIGFVPTLLFERPVTFQIGPDHPVDVVAYTVEYVGGGRLEIWYDADVAKSISVEGAHRQGDEAE